MSLNFVHLTTTAERLFEEGPNPPSFWKEETSVRKYLNNKKYFPQNSFIIRATKSI